MAAGAWTVYTNAALNALEGGINLQSGTIVMALLTGAYTPAVNTDATWSNVSADEVATGGGYTQGGQVLGSQSLTISGATVVFTGGSVTWAGFTATCRYAVLVQRAGASLAPTDKLVTYVDLTNGGGNLVGQGGPLEITPNAAGILVASHTP